MSTTTIKLLICIVFMQCITIKACTEKPPSPIHPDLLVSTVITPRSIPNYQDSSLLTSTVVQLTKDRHIEQLTQDVWISSDKEGAIIEGGDLMHEILQNPPINALEKDGPQPAYVWKLNEQSDYLLAIVSLMWYLYAEAINKQQAFIEGSFIMLDEHYKLYNFLLLYARRYNNELTGIHDQQNHQTTNPFACSRKSSHWETCQTEWSHYGIDIRFGADEQPKKLLPTDKPHLLFGIVGNEPERLFIKFEDYGLYRGATADNCWDLIGHAWGYIRSRIPKQQKKIPQTLYTILEPIFGSDDGPDMRKEHTPVEFANRCKALLSPYPTIVNKYYDELNDHGVAKLGSYIEEKPADWPQKLYDAFKEYYHELCSRLDYPEIRKGLEVIIGPDELISSLFYHCILTGNQKAPFIDVFYQTRQKQRNLQRQLTQLAYKLERSTDGAQQDSQDAQMLLQRLERTQQALELIGAECNKP